MGDFYCVLSIFDYGALLMYDLLIAAHVCGKVYVRHENQCPCFCEKEGTRTQIQACKMQKSLVFRGSVIWRKNVLLRVRKKYN